MNRVQVVSVKYMLRKLCLFLIGMAALLVLGCSATEERAAHDVMDGGQTGASQCEVSPPAEPGSEVLFDSSGFSSHKPEDDEDDMERLDHCEDK